MFFDPTGYTYPAGFPKGGTRWTTPKVIVARAFPGPGSGEPGRLAVDPRASFHGTHVAGIAAGNAGTTAPAGPDHPRTTGLSGVAPRAWLGNYRVFTVPTPIGHVANTPEIVAAFESAVADGMDVINFSGGGSETEPVNDAMIETVANVVAAGVVPVISAGNDRDDFGTGTAGSPGTAPEAISVAAVSSDQVFGSSLELVDPVALARPLPFKPTPGARFPDSWTAGVPLRDVGTIGDPYLCGPEGNPNAGGLLPAGSLNGAVALVQRGICTFTSKVERARRAGAVGIVFVDNRAGEANTVPTQLELPSGMIADADGAALKTALVQQPDVRFRYREAPLAIQTGRSGIVTSFSSGGPTAFGHLLKPDVAAPGGQILSATLPQSGGPFAVFDGTSMAAPHVAGAAALLRQRHPGWTPRQVKSALVQTGGPAWADSARTKEAPVTLQGGGLVDLTRADRPLVFAEPSSFSYGDLDVRGGARSRSLLTTIRDAGDGAGTWQVELRPQSASAGATIELPASVTLAPGGEAQLVATARAAADAAEGENYGFVVLRRGTDTRRIPYFFLVKRPALGGAHGHAAADPAAGRHARDLGGRGLPLPRRGLRPAADVHRADDGGERRRAALQVRPRPPGGELRRRRHRLRGGDGRRPVGARLEGRERRPGRRGHARQRQSADDRLPPRRRHGRRVPPAARRLLRLGRLAARRVHRTALRRALRAEGLGRRRLAAADRPGDDPRLGRTADARRPRRRRLPGARRRRRPALAGDRVPRRGRRRRALRPRRGPRALPAPGRRAADPRSDARPRRSSPPTSRRRRT